jgi:uncharacterized protein (DUF924 family)
MTHLILKLTALLLPIALLIASLTNIQMLTLLTSRATSRLPRIFTPRRAMSTSTFHLDPAIFNATLYTQVTDTWLPGVDLRGEDLDYGVLKRWFMLNGNERDAFDGQCRARFAHALEAIGPDKLATPSAQPFLDEIERVARTGDGGQAAWTALSLTLLLDQIPRNIYRSEAGLRKVYTHYDAISYALSRTLLSDASPVPRVDLHPQWRHSGAHRLWFYLPLMHSELIEAHDFLAGKIEEATQDAEASEQELKATKMFIDGQVKAEKEHRDILDRFGRYPHRNAALGRVSTEEEKRFLSEGGKTFGVRTDTEKKDGA